MAEPLVEEKWEVSYYYYRGTIKMYDVVCRTRTDNKIIAECYKQEDAEAIVLAHNARWRRCPIHTQVDGRFMWGCPDCLTSLRLGIDLTPKESDAS